MRSCVGNQNCSNFKMVTAVSCLGNSVLPQSTAPNEPSWTTELVCTLISESLITCLNSMAASHCYETVAPLRSCSPPTGIWKLFPWWHWPPDVSLGSMTWRTSVGQNHSQEPWGDSTGETRDWKWQRSSVRDGKMGEPSVPSSRVMQKATL